MRILVANAGSSSLKLRQLDHDDRLAASVDLPAPQGQVEHSGIAEIVAGFGPVDWVGHRIVHGGSEFTHAARASDDVVRRLHDLADRAPLHQAASLAVLAAVSRALPDVPAVVCFDTAFHASMSDAAATYALPEEWRRTWDLRRHGFHGLSHAYSARRAAKLLGADAGTLRVVSCHLGAGASLAAIAGGRSCDTTMGFTPLEGLVMATRSGSIDPGLVLWLQAHAGISADEVSSALEHRSGLLGLTGTADIREIVLRAAASDPAASLGLEVYLHRLRAGIAAMSAAMEGLDALVFTGGVGENSAAVRQRTVDGLKFLGVCVDTVRNGSGTDDREIGSDGALVRTLVVASREDLEIARQVRELARQHRPG